MPDIEDVLEDAQRDIKSIASQSSRVLKPS